MTLNVADLINRFANFFKNENNFNLLSSLSPLNVDLNFTSFYIAILFSSWSAWFGVTFTGRTLLR